MYLHMQYDNKGRKDRNRNKERLRVKTCKATIKLKGRGQILRSYHDQSLTMQVEVCKAAT